MKGISNIKNRYIFLGDLILIPVSVLGSYALRLELGGAFLFYLPSAYWMIGAALIVKPTVFYFFGLYRRMWVYASTSELKIILAAVTSSSVVVSLVMVVAFTLKTFIGFPRSVLVIDWLLSMILVGGLRFLMRLLAEIRSTSNIKTNAHSAKKALIVGAGDAGAMVVRELTKNPQLDLLPIGFLDDNPTKQRQQIFGVPVVGIVDDLAKVIESKHVDEVIIAIPSAPGRVVRIVADVCRKKGISFRTIPGIYELLGGKVSISRLREVDITDLLRREPAHVKDIKVGEIIRERAVLVTGAGGSIGRELCRQIAQWGPHEIILLGHGENSIYETLVEMKESFPAIKMSPVIADIRDRTRINNTFIEYNPDLVFHAAAHKHVPMMQVNVEEAVTNNIEGTRNIVQVAIDHNIERLVMISTDKAIKPINVMGATKRMAEMIVIDAAQKHHKDFSVVRFGNVLGSRGSVVPLFKRQIARGGPVTVTHPDMKRYFMTIPEAVYLVLQAASMGEGGETYVLNMGQQVRILDLAEDLIRLSGLEPGRDIEIMFTGVRPGEKISEDLWDEKNLFQPTGHPDVYRAEGEQTLMGRELQTTVSELLRLAKESTPASIIELLDIKIPDAAVGSTPALEILSID